MGDPLLKLEKKFLWGNYQVFVCEWVVLYFNYKKSFCGEITKCLFVSGWTFTSIIKKVFVWKLRSVCEPVGGLLTSIVKIVKKVFAGKLPSVCV